jgi:signal transduction histidine kinase
VLVALTSTDPAGDAVVSAGFPQSVQSAEPHAKVVRERAPLNIADVQTDSRLTESARAFARARGFRSWVVVPLLRQAEAVGAMGVTRRASGGFTDDEILLLQTFADQAVIAIENVRLFKELEARNRDLTEALEQQTATAEVLKLISRSTFDLRPILETLIEHAARLCRAEGGCIYRKDAELQRLAAAYNMSPEHRDFVEQNPVTQGRGTAVGRAILERHAVHIHDVKADPNYTHGAVGIGGYRTLLGVPMMREDVPIGVFAVWRTEVLPFTDKQIELVTTFADQGAIAIENVRLFKQLQGRNAELTEALETQTATSEILRVISQSPTDVQPVFDTIVRNAVRLCDAIYGLVYRSAGEHVYLAAHHNFSPAQLEEWQQTFPRPLNDSGASVQVIRTGAVLRVADVETEHDSSISEAGRALLRSQNAHSVLIVPMFRQHKVIGSITLTHRAVGAFTNAHVELLKTFADQAVIAIENVRLFKELEARTRELTRSVSELMALGAVSEALSSTLDVDIVLDTIVTRANDLIGADGCTIFEYDEAAEQFHLRATRNLEPRLVELARGTPLRRGDQGILGRLPSERQPVQVPDITVGSYSSPISDALIEAGYRAVVAVPLVREDHLIGALTMNRKTPGEFPPETIQLLQTFATQSALAIQNARLFREIEDKSRQLEVASHHKSEFLANMSHELRTPLNAIIGFSEVLTDRMFGELNEKQEEYLKDIYASGTHLLSLINDILDLSKIEAGRMELELTHFHLPTALDNALTLVRERAGRRSITLQMSIDERLGEVRADERKIRQVVLNLLSNAIKFTPEGGRIEVGSVPRDGFVEVSVSDTGVGIAPEDQEAVFEEFRQVGTAEKKAEGTGLGLTLSRKFIELHGGRIWVTSQVGVGSTFTFTIPVHRGN